MAKQMGVHKLHGKVDEQSYYYSKNGGYVTRKINPGMSQKVKTDAAYANTRLNNAEFGACGAYAGAMLRPVTQRWRFILDSIATGMLVKAMKAAMQEDTTSAWGKRLIPQAQMAGIQDVFNSFSKNEFPSEVKSGLSSNLIYDSSVNKSSLGDAVSFSNDTIEQYKAKGADGVKSRVFAYTVTAPTISADGKSYARPLSLFAEAVGLSNDCDFTISPDTPILVDEIINDSPAILNETSHFGGLLVILMPYKKVGTAKYTLQELCSAVWVPATAGTIE